MHRNVVGLLALCAALLVAAIAPAAGAAKDTKRATVAAKACKDKKKAAKAKCLKRAKQRKTSSKDPATLRAEQRCRAERSRLRGDFERAWGGGREKAMQRCVAALKADEDAGPAGDLDALEDEELDDEELLEDEELDDDEELLDDEEELEDEELEEGFRLVG